MLFFTDDVLLVEFMYLVFIHMPAKSYCRWSMVCVAVYDIFRALINFSVHSFCTTMWSVHKEMLISQVTHPQSQRGNKTQSTQPHWQSRASTHAGFIFTVTIASLSPSSHCHHHHTVAFATLSPSLLDCHHCSSHVHENTAKVQHISPACSPPFSTFWRSVPFFFPEPRFHAHSVRFFSKHFGSLKLCSTLIKTRCKTGVQVCG